ncbi:hypothetical protein [Micromonospora sp. NPDC049240]|uniref:hypothetical protein n=1 Tax=Micromonospora sp. NPDC049240 TaxID=3155151 RepID=UPI003402D51D
MGRHSLTPEKRDARRRAVRTRFQAFLAACSVLLVAVPVALDAVGEALPPKVYAVLAGAALVITQVAGTITRIMALPAVRSFIDQYLPWLSAE